MSWVLWRPCAKRFLSHSPVFLNSKGSLFPSNLSMGNQHQEVFGVFGAELGYSPGKTFSSGKVCSLTLRSTRHFITFCCMKGSKLHCSIFRWGPLFAQFHLRCLQILSGSATTAVQPGKIFPAWCISNLALESGNSSLSYPWKVLTVGASITGWLYNSLTVQGTWSPQELMLSISILEWRVIRLTLIYYTPLPQCYAVGFPTWASRGYQKLCRPEGTKPYYLGEEPHSQLSAVTHWANLARLPELPMPRFRKSPPSGDLPNNAVRNGVHHIWSILMFLIAPHWFRRSSTSDISTSGGWALAASKQGRPPVTRLTSILLLNHWL